MVSADVKHHVYLLVWCNQSSATVWTSRWLFWLPIPNNPYDHCGRKATLNWTLKQQCEPAWPSGKALGWQAEEIRFNSIRLSFLFFCFFFKCCSLWTLSCGCVFTVNETIKWLTPTPILIQRSFWWWQCSFRYSIRLSPSPGSRSSWVTLRRHLGVKRV